MNNSVIKQGLNTYEELEPPPPQQFSDLNKIPLQKGNFAY